MVREVEKDWILISGYWLEFDFRIWVGFFLAFVILV